MTLPVVPVMSKQNIWIIHNGDSTVRTQWSQHHLNDAFNHVTALYAFCKGFIERVTLMVLKNVLVSKNPTAPHFHFFHVLHN